jgi:hypothetical protein
MFQHELREHKLVTLKETVQKVCSNKGADCPLPLFNWILDFKNTVLEIQKKPQGESGKRKLIPPEGKYDKMRLPTTFWVWHAE